MRYGRWPELSVARVYQEHEVMRKVMLMCHLAKFSRDVPVEDTIVRSVD